MSAPRVQFSLPPLWFFDFPPSPSPQTLPPPPSGENWWRSPIDVDTGFYNAVLKPEIPLTFAVIYIATDWYLNRLNDQRGRKAWWISKTNAFHTFKLLHNALLAIYSAVTCAALTRVISVSVPGVFESSGIAGVADGLCKMHGPRGYGDAVTYKPNDLLWRATNEKIHLGQDMLNPDATDVGRIWNEGLAFWGWLFYLSKFYEVVDTLLILAAGKKSSLLQKYHHAGAMLCMWAGIRYMSPPIWMFVLVNSGIHAIMYTYYLLSTLGYRVPKVVKQTITTLQIVQFVFGASYAAIHLFISYTIPITTTFSIASALAAVPTQLASQMNGDGYSWLKKMAYRAAGAEGLAEMIKNEHGHAFGPEYGMPRSSRSGSLHTKTGYQMVHCLDTSGQAFAIYLNVIYLTPLTVLFVRFFTKSYRAKRLGTDAKDGMPRPVRAAGDAARRTSDAVQGLATDLEERMSRELKELRDSVPTQDIKEKIEAVKQGAEESVAPAAQGEKNVSTIAEEITTATTRAMSSVSENIKDTVKEAIGVRQSGEQLEEEVAEEDTAATAAAERSVEEEIASDEEKKEAEPATQAKSPESSFVEVSPQSDSHAFEQHPPKEEEVQEVKSNGDEGKAGDAKEELSTVSPAQEEPAATPSSKKAEESKEDEAALEEKSTEGDDEDSFTRTKKDPEEGSDGEANGDVLKANGGEAQEQKQESEPVPEAAPEQEQGQESEPTTQPVQEGAPSGGDDQQSRNMGFGIH